jgi:mycothiol synthase
MIEIRAAKSDAELDAWRRVRQAVLPNERVPTVAELRDRPDERLLVLAYLDGEVAGSGITAKSDTGGVFVQPRVLSERRGRGVGTALLRALADQAVATGHADASAHVEEAASLGFATRFGFQETDRQVEQVRTIASAEADPQLPPGIELVPLAGRPDLAARLFDELVRDAIHDFAVDRPIDIDEESWKNEWLRDTDGCFVALDRAEIVGLAGFERDPDRRGRAENALTAVRRDHRRRGIARALKQAVIVLAAGEGITELYTWTQQRNVSMRSLNRSLGYVDRDVSITVRGRLPLP